MSQARFVLPLLAGLLALGSACDGEVVQIVSPGSGTTVTAAQTLNLRVALTPVGQESVDLLGGLERIDFWVDGGLACSVSAAPFSCPWPVSSAQNGLHTWHATVHAANGLEKVSATATLVVDVPAGPTGEPALLGFLPGMGSARDVVPAGATAYVASDTFGIAVVDDVTTGAPTVTAASTSAFSGEHLAVAGTRGVATGVAEDGTATLYVLDLPPAGWPEVVGTLETTLVPGSTTGFHDVAIDPSGSHAVVAAGSDGVWVVDLSTPSAPSVLGSYDAPEWNAWSLGVALQGGYAYVAEGGRGLKVLSLANPSQPTLVGTRMLSGTQQSVAVSGVRAYVASQTGALRVLDVANPTAPVWLGTGAMSGVGLRVAAQGNQVATLAASGADSVLDLFDATNPTIPAKTGSVVVGPLSEGKGLALAGGRAWVAAGSGGLQVYDAGSASLSLSGLVEDRFVGEQMGADGDLAVVVGHDVNTGHAHLQVLDLANPAQPVRTGELATSIVPGSVTGFRDVVVSRSRNLAVVAAGSDGVWLVDVSNRSFPVVVGIYDSPGWVMGLDLDASASHAYLADGTGGLKVLSLANPSQPTLVGSLGFSGTQRDVAVEGGLAFVVNQGGSMRVVDVTNPASPRWIGSASLSGFGYHVAVSGDLAVVHSGNSSDDFLDVLDVSNPSSATRIASLAVADSGAAGGVDVSGNLAAVAAGPEGLLLYDLADPASPDLLSSGEVVGEVHDAALDGATVCVTGFPAVVSILGL